MENFESPQAEAAKLRELSKSLRAMRDALMRASLALHDLKFEMDAQARQNAQAQAANVLQNYRRA